jgi:hypothetical protein
MMTRQKRWSLKHPGYIAQWEQKHPGYHRVYESNWRKSKKGYLSKQYSGMVQRIKGRNQGRDYLYEGLPIMSRNEFYSFANKDEAFKELFSMWIRSGYYQQYAPSIDRIDSTKGYIIGNIRFITFYENSLRGLKNELERRKIEGKYSRKRITYES